MTKMKQCSNGLHVLYSREDNPGTEEVQCLTSSTALFPGFWAKASFTEHLSSSVEMAHDWQSLHIQPYLERSRIKEIGREAKVALVFGNWIYCMSGPGGHLQEHKSTIC